MTTVEMLENGVTLQQKIQKMKKNMYIKIAVSIDDLEEVLGIVLKLVEQFMIAVMDQLLKPKAMRML